MSNETAGRMEFDLSPVKIVHSTTDDHWPWASYSNSSNVYEFMHISNCSSAVSNLWWCWLITATKQIQNTAYNKNSHFHLSAIFPENVNRFLTTQFYYFSSFSLQAALGTHNKNERNRNETKNLPRSKSQFLIG